MVRTDFFPILTDSLKMANLLVLTIYINVISRVCFGEINTQKFPDGFSFGAATAAYQIEGAWNTSGKGESIWDHFVHTNSSRIVDGSNADIACDSFHKYKEDIALAADMGLTHYRFSVSWTRILPNGYNNIKNIDGIMYYQNVVKEIEKRNMTPMVTIYHWDLPETIQDIGGWVNPKIVEYFRDYAEIVFESLPTVKLWITINEPKQVCQGGYGKGSMAPGYTESGVSDYLCSYHIIKAHAAAYNLYQEKFKNLGGKITMAIDGVWSIPYSDEEEHKEAASRKLAFEFGLYAHPIFFGDWPEVVKQRVAERSSNESFTKSRLPPFTEDDISQINGTADYVAFNFYDTKLIKNVEEADFDSVSYDNDLRTSAENDPKWNTSIDGTTSIYPNGLCEYLNWIKNNYNNPDIYITENGVADDGSTLDDKERINYLTDYLTAVLDAIYKYEVKVKAYTMWSLLDNFEWRKGYSVHMGFFSVDFEDPERKRTPKKSVKFFRELIEKGRIPYIPHAITEPSSTTPSSTTEHHNSGSQHFIEAFFIIVPVIFYFSI
ncbi:myrosinase 1-like [Diorhabda carinulata]|uniref:myrosinase 1-like n=1 Tax=Diorhabda carinulata TaxID=1163345 RepID=UPI0025A14EF5|nr:myrosinase 1-like [Diorhabda carinulata]